MSIWIIHVCKILQLMVKIKKNFKKKVLGHGQITNQKLIYWGTESGHKAFWLLAADWCMGVNDPRIDLDSSIRIVKEIRKRVLILSNKYILLISLNFT